MFKILDKVQDYTHLPDHTKLALKECSVVAVKTGFVIETNSTKHNSNSKIQTTLFKCNNCDLKINIIIITCKS